MHYTYASDSPDVQYMLAQCDILDALTGDMDMYCNVSNEVRAQIIAIREQNSERVAAHAMALSSGMHLPCEIASDGASYDAMCVLGECVGDRMFQCKLFTTMERRVCAGSQLNRHINIPESRGVFPEFITAHVADIVEIIE